DGGESGPRTPRESRYRAGHPDVFTVDKACDVNGGLRIGGLQNAPRGQSRGAESAGDEATFGLGDGNDPGIVPTTVGNAGVSRAVLHGAAVAAEIGDKAAVVRVTPEINVTRAT